MDPQRFRFSDVSLRVFIGHMSSESGHEAESPNVFANDALSHRGSRGAALTGEPT